MMHKLNYKMKMTKKFKKYKKDIITGYVNVGKNIIIKKLSMAYNIG